MIHRIRIRNFKSLADVDVELSPVTVLVGKSGTGKSNFVEALRFLRDVLASKRTLQQVWAQIRPTPASDAPTSFCVDFSVGSDSEAFHYELTLDKGGPGNPVLEERLALGGKELFHQASAPLRWIIKPELFELPTPGPILLGRIPSISEVVTAYTALTLGIGCYVFSDKVLCGPGGTNGASEGLADDAGNYLDAIRDLVRNLHDLSSRKSIIAALNHVNPSVSSVELNDIQDPKSVVVGHRFENRTLSLGLAQESDGFRRFYAHLLALYQQPPKQTLIFEHPEDGIHPGALSLLAEEFQAAPDHKRGQVILTTHSPQLLDHFDEEQIRVVELAGWETRIGPLSKEQRESLQERLLEPGELLTVDPARIAKAEAAGT